MGKILKGAMIFGLAIVLLTSLAGAANYGDPIGEYISATSDIQVTAYSNGACVAKYGTDGCPAIPKWQCVEYVKRFYEDAMSVSTSSWSGNANTYYVRAISGTFSPYLTPLKLTWHQMRSIMLVPYISRQRNHQHIAMTNM